MNLTPHPPRKLHGCQCLKFYVSETRAIPSVPSAYPGGPELLSLLRAKQLGQALLWGTLQEEGQVTGLEVRLFPRWPSESWHTGLFLELCEHRTAVFSVLLGLRQSVMFPRFTGLFPL